MWAPEPNLEMWGPPLGGRGEMGQRARQSTEQQGSNLRSRSSGRHSQTASCSMKWLESRRGRPLSVSGKLYLSWGTAWVLGPMLKGTTSTDSWATASEGFVWTACKAPHVLWSPWDSNMKSLREETIGVLKHPGLKPQCVPSRLNQQGRLSNTVLVTQVTELRKPTGLANGCQWQ